MENLNNVKNVILVLSGKGGVGKSTLSTQLALGLAAENHKVGLLDVDLCGPSIPRMLNLENSSIHQCDDGWLPVYVSPDKKLSVMSIGFLLGNKNDPVIWRGPKKNAMIKQFLTDVVWGELDFLVIDTPPGTSDEHLAVVENLKGRTTGAILVTTPQVSIRILLKKCQIDRSLINYFVVGSLGSSCCRRPARANILSQDWNTHFWFSGEHVRLCVSTLFRMSTSFFSRRRRRSGKARKNSIPRKCSY